MLSLASTAVLKPCISRRLIHGEITHTEDCTRDDLLLDEIYQTLFGEAVFASVYHSFIPYLTAFFLEAILLTYLLYRLSRRPKWLSILQKISVFTRKLRLSEEAVQKRTVVERSKSRGREECAECARPLHAN